MADGIFPSLVSRTRDVNAADNVIFIQVADNAGNVASITGGKLDVNASVTIETAYVDDSAFTIGTDKVNAQGFLADETSTDSVDEGDIGLARMTLTRIQLATIDDGAGNRLSIDGSGYITSNINGTVDVSGSTVDCNGSDVTIDNAAGAAAVNIQDGGNSITVDGTVGISGTVAVTQSGTWDIGTVTTLTGITNDVNIADGGNSITVDAVALDIRALSDATDSVSIGDGTDTLGVNSDGSINVNIVSAAITGEVHDYDTAAAVASDSTSNHDYTVANSVFLLKSVIASGSGNVKFEVQTGPLASLATVAVGFLTGRQGDTKQLFFDPPIEVPVASTGTVRVIRTNRQGQATDVYSTIIGVDV